MSDGQPITVHSIGDTSGTATLLIVLTVLPALGAVAALASGAVIGGVVLLLIAAAIGYFAIRRLRVVRRLEPGLLDLPSGTIYLGRATPARFRRRVKQGTTDTTELTAHLILREWVRYTVGTDTRTATEQLLSVPVPLQRGYDGQHVLADLTLPIPDYPPSFEASNNSVTWRLEVHATFADGFTEDSVFPIWVSPAIHRSEMGRQG